MFTGLIEEVGRIASLRHRGAWTDITVTASSVTDDMSVGDSIAINGACQTVVTFDPASFTVQAVGETLRRTTFARLRQGDPVNLERALRLNDRLGGHIVQGHVDGTGRVTGKRGTADNMLLSIAPAGSLERYIVEKGSVTIDGVSLTVTLSRAGEFGVSVIPHTLGQTTLGTLRVGDEVNIETDILARYVEKLMGGGGGLTLDSLDSLGY